MLTRGEKKTTALTTGSSCFNKQLGGVVEILLSCIKKGTSVSC